MNEFKKHTDKIAISILRGEYADYEKNWWYYDKEYNMLLKAQTEAFKLANEASEQQDKEAIDTVVAEVEKHLPTLKQSDDKRLLFSAYLQGKRDQIYWATKWEELTPIGKYRMMKQFLAWYQTLKLKEITK